MIFKLSLFVDSIASAPGANILTAEYKISLDGLVASALPLITAIRYVVTAFSYFFICCANFHWSDFDVGSSVDMCLIKYSPLSGYPRVSMYWKSNNVFRHSNASNGWLVVLCADPIVNLNALVISLTTGLYFFTITSSLSTTFDFPWRVEVGIEQGICAISRVAVPRHVRRLAH
jgi:hypothetical protein